MNDAARNGARFVVDDSVFGFSPHQTLGSTWITVIALAVAVLVTCALWRVLVFLSPPERRASYGPLEQVLEDDGKPSGRALSREALRRRLRL